MDDRHNDDISARHRRELLDDDTATARTGYRRGTDRYAVKETEADRAERALDHVEKALEYLRPLRDPLLRQDIVGLTQRAAWMRNSIALVRQRD